MARLTFGKPSWNFAARFSYFEKTAAPSSRERFGDSVVLDGDVLTVPGERLRSISPDLTVIGRRVAYERRRPGHDELRIRPKTFEKSPASTLPANRT